MAYSALTTEKKEEYEELGFDEAKIVDINKKAQKQLEGKQEKLCLSMYNKIPPNRKVLRLLMLGKTGVGKSATGNLIMGENTFPEDISSESCTETIKLGKTTIDGTEIQIIDTPGFFDTNAPPEQAITEIAKVVEVYKEGIDGVLFVYSMGNPRFTAEEQAAFNDIEQGAINLGFIDNCFVVITHGDMLVGRRSLAEYMQQELHSPFGKLLNETVQKRVIAVDNAEPTVYGRQIQREQLVRMVAAKTSGPCTPEVFKKYVESQSELMEKTPERFRHMVPDIEQKVVQELVSVPRNELVVMTDDQLKKLTENIMDQLLASTNPEAGGKDDELADVVANVAGTVIKRVTHVDFLQHVAKVAVPLLKAGLGVVIEAGKALWRKVSKVGKGLFSKK